MFLEIYWLVHVDGLIVPFLDVCLGDSSWLCLRPRIQDILDVLQQESTDWYFIPLLSESDTDLSRYSPEVKKHLANLGSLAEIS